jgi:anti-anti-sigma factor
MPNARIASHRIHYNVSSDCAVVRPEGPCDAKTTEALATLVNSPLIESKNLIIDLSHSDYVETPGYRWLMRRLKELDASGRKLIVAGLSPSVERAFKLLRLDLSIPTAENVSEALERIHSTEGKSLVQLSKK